MRPAAVDLPRDTQPLAALGCALLACLALPAPAVAQGLSVRIEAPHAGVVSGPVVQFEAAVRAPGARHATLVVNGSAYDVPIEQGRVRQQIVAVPGNNRVALAVEHGGRVASESLTFRYGGPPVELVVLLTWPSEGEVIDLWVREPGGETCKWDHRRTAAGGRLLDFSADAIGFGSQAYVLSQVQAGAFRLKIHYWGAWADDDQRSQGTYEDGIAALDRAEERLAAGGGDTAALTREVAGARRRLDLWARPAAPQTAVRAEVVLFPGTRHERRWRFDRVVHRTGELVTLGDVEIDEATLQAARQEAP